MAAFAVGYSGEGGGLDQDGLWRASRRLCPNVDETRAKIKGIAEDLGYVTNLAARGVRQGWLALIGVVADELITSPIATEIIRGLDGAARNAQLAVFVMNLSGNRDVSSVLEEVRRFRPRAVAFAAMYHKTVSLLPDVANNVGVMINCREADGRVTSLVPDEEAAAVEVTRHLIAAGRRRIAFISLPGLLAGDLREQGFRSALAEADLAPIAVLPAVRRGVCSDRAPSLILNQVSSLMQTADRPDAILCGNDRVAMEVYAALRRVGAAMLMGLSSSGKAKQPRSPSSLRHEKMPRQAISLRIRLENLSWKCLTSKAC